MLLISALAVLLGATGTWYATSSDRHSRSEQDSMADRAAHVMPFDLSATTHTFTKTSTGGVEQVVAKNPRDDRNIALIRQHLRAEADKFARGDYGDPATIHGATMPGLNELRTAGDRIRIKYDALPAGAHIVFEADDATMVDALHAWFDAQNSDHAMPGMGG